MTGFAVLAPNFDTNDPLNHPRRFRNMSLVLMASRLVLVLQYASIAWYIRGYRKTLSAKIITIGTLFASALVFLILAVASSKQRARYAYLGWYIVPAIEAVVMVAISSFWKVLSFKGTPIVDRFGGMTLIALGEGTVGMTKAVRHRPFSCCRMPPNVHLGHEHCSRHIIPNCFFHRVDHLLYHDPCES